MASLQLILKNRKYNFPLLFQECRVLFFCFNLGVQNVKVHDAFYRFPQQLLQRLRFERLKLPDVGAVLRYKLLVVRRRFFAFIFAGKLNRLACSAVNATLTG